MDRRRLPTEGWKLVGRLPRYVIWPAGLLCVLGCLMVSKSLAFILSWFGAGLLIPVLANWVLLALGLAAWRRKAPIWVIAIPLLVYGAYAVAVGVSEARHMRRDAAARAQNRRFTVTFDPQRDVLVAAGADQLGAPLLEQFLLPTVYTIGEDLRPFGEYRVVPPQLCSGYDLPGYIDLTHRAGLCVVGVPVDALPPQTVRVRQEFRAPDGNSNSLSLYELVVNRPGEPPQTLVTGADATLFPIPFPSYGCYDAGCEFEWATLHRSIAGGKFQDGRSDALGPTELLLADLWRLKPRKASDDVLSPPEFRARIEDAHRSARDHAARELENPTRGAFPLVGAIAASDKEWASNHKVAIASARDRALAAGDAERAYSLTAALNVLNQQLARPGIPPKPAGGLGLAHGP